jgi:uncharacterized protein
MMRIALAGGTGFVGRALHRHWTGAGIEVVRLVRRPAEASDESEWNPEAGRIDLAPLADCAALVNLAGENIAAERWTEARKKLIRASRVRTTELLGAAMASGSWRPRVWVNASAVGYYGDGGERELDEAAPQGAGFLASVCGDWEAATLPAESAGVRVVRLRLGAVLDPAGGALAKLLPVFRAGFGGPLGGGRMWMSWIALDELCRVVDAALSDERLAGAVNAVSEEPVRNADFAAALGRTLHRPALVPTPAWAVRALVGEMGRETLLASARAVPCALLQSGYEFRPGGLPDALRRMLR